MNINFWTLPGCASGLGVTCNSLAADVCCSNPVRTVLSSVQFIYSVPKTCHSDRVYLNGQCTTQANTATANACLNGAYTGAKWLNLCRRRRELLSDGLEGTSSDCTSLSKPNTLFYKENEAKGTWVLKVADVTYLLLQLQSVPDAEKVAWMTAQGASYESMTQAENDVYNCPSACTVLSPSK